MPVCADTTGHGHQPVPTSWTKDGDRTHGFCLDTDPLFPVCAGRASFNIFHSHQLGDRYRFLEGMYSMLTGAHSQQTHIACETRGGITGIAGHIGIYAIRLSVVDDLVEPNVLHLLRLVPKAWLAPGRPTRFDRIPTVFGPVSVRFEMSEAGSALRIDYERSFHHRPARVVLHVPPVESVSSVRINGKSYETSGRHLVVVE